jgi:hypothetical protein
MHGPLVTAIVTVTPWQCHTRFQVEQAPAKGGGRRRLPLILCAMRRRLDASKTTGRHQE